MKITNLIDRDQDAESTSNVVTFKDGMFLTLRSEGEITDNYLITMTLAELKDMVAKVEAEQRKQRDAETLYNDPVLDAFNRKVMGR